MVRIWTMLAMVCLFCGSAAAANIQVITEISPPLNYTEDGTDAGKVTGMATEIVQEIMNRTGMKSDIQVMPWARGYKLVQEEPNVALFSTTRTEQRENMFKWVGPLAAKKWVFYKKKGAGVSINSMEDAKKVSAIGTYTDDAKEQTLKKEGFTNLDSATDDTANLKKLLGGRIDLWVAGDIDGIMVAKNEGVDPAELEEAYTIKEAHLYVAFSKQTDDAIVNKWQAAFDEIKADGTWQKIRDNYLK